MVGSLSQVSNQSRRVQVKSQTNCYRFKINLKISWDSCLKTAQHKSKSSLKSVNTGSCQVLWNKFKSSCKSFDIDPGNSQVNRRQIQAKSQFQIKSVVCQNKCQIKSHIFISKLHINMRMLCDSVFAFKSLLIVLRTRTSPVSTQA